MAETALRKLNNTLLKLLKIRLEQIQRKISEVSSDSRETGNPQREDFKSRKEKLLHQRMRILCRIETVVQELETPPLPWLVDAKKREYDKVSNFDELEDLFILKTEHIESYERKKNLEDIFYCLRNHHAERRLSFADFTKSLIRFDLLMTFYPEIASDVAGLSHHIPSLTGMQFILQDDENAGLFGKRSNAIGEKIRATFSILEKMLEDMADKKKYNEHEKKRCLRYGKVLLLHFKTLFSELYNKVREEAHRGNLEEGAYIKAILASKTELSNNGCSCNEELNWGELTYDPTGINSTRLKYDKGSYYG